MPLPPSASTCLKNLLRGFLVLVVVDDDGGAGPGKALCRGRTDTSARPGDESDFPLERLRV